MAYKIPILLITWRRPDTTAKVLNSLRKIQPNKIYIASDGPEITRKGEVEKVKETRELIDNKITWKCTVEKLYSENNQGCKQGVRKSIDWFFSHEEMGIILEDDIVPKEEFFYFCEYNLKKHQKNKNIYTIGGFSALINEYPYLSMHGSVWGWATWRDRWLNYEEKIPNNKDFESLKSNSSNFSIMTWKLASRIQKGKNPIDTWDYWWLFTRIRNRGYSLLPSKALTYNCGISSEGSTHMKNKDFRLINIMKMIKNSPAIDKKDLEKDPISINDAVIKNYDKKRLSARFGRFNILFIHIKLILKNYLIN